MTGGARERGREAMVWWALTVHDSLVDVAVGAADGLLEGVVAGGRAVGLHARQQRAVAEVSELHALPGYT